MNKNSGLSRFFDTAEGYVIFPNVGEGDFIISASSLNEILHENGQVMGMADLKKLDVGYQIVGQDVTELISFETEETLNAFSGEV